MNCKKTWYGYVNYILATIIISALIVAVVDFNIVFDMVSFINNPENGLVYSNQPIPEIAAMFIGAGVLCFFAVIFYAVRKIRERINRNNGIFDTDKVSDSVGSVISFILFIAGVTLRVIKILDSTGKRITTTVNLAGIEENFNTGYTFNLSSSDNFYDSIVGLLYRFLGIKTDTYMWVNLVLQLLIILLVYSSIRNIFNSFVAILPLIYYCLSPELIHTIVNGGYENLRIIFCLLGISIITSIIKIFKEAKYYHIFALVLTVLIEFVFLLFIPQLYCHELFSVNSFAINFSAKLSGIFRPFNMDYICIAMLILMMYASISFFFSKRDNISLIFPIWLVSLFFYLFTKNNWPNEVLIFILFWTYAGLGLDELLVSQVSTDYVVDEPEHAKESIDIYVPKPALEEIKLPVETKETENPDLIETDETIVEPEVSEMIEVEEETEVAEAIEVEEEPEVTETIEEEIESEIAETNEGEVKSEVTETVEETKEPKVIEEVEVENKPAVQLLVSPLPLPKKHEKKEISYAFEPAIEDMKFDVEISDNDDFDI